MYFFCINYASHVFLLRQKLLNAGMARHAHTPCAYKKLTSLETIAPKAPINSILALLYSVDIPCLHI